MFTKRGHINRRVRERVKNRFGGKCGYCGVQCEKIFIDHIVPHSDKRNEFPNLEKNLMPACFACNTFKNAFSVEEFRNQMHLQVERARKNSGNFRNAERFGLLKITNEPIIFHFER